jgi:hypothetical protein
MKGKPYSDSEIKPETPEVLRQLDKLHYRSPEWSRGVVPDKQRGLGITDVDDTAADVYQTNDTISEKGKI